MSAEQVQTVEWKCPLSETSKYPEYAVTIRTDGAVTLADADGQRYQMGLPERPHEYTFLGGWAAESFRRNNRLELAFRYHFPPAESSAARLDLTFATESDVTLAPRDTPELGESLSSVLSMSIIPNQSVRLTVKKPAPDIGRSATAQDFSQSPPTPFRPAPDAWGAAAQPGNAEELRETGRLLADSRRELEDSRQALEESERKSRELRARLREREEELAFLRSQPKADGAETERLREERETWKRQADEASSELRDAQAALYELAKSKLNELERWFSANCGRLSDELREQAAAAQRAGAEIRDMQARLKDGESRAARQQEEREKLAGELEKMRLLEADLSVDRDAAQREIDGLRMRIGDDADSLALLNADSSLVTASVEKRLNEARENLEAAEQGLLRIIRWREKTNGSVYQSIMGGDGALPLEQKAGEGEHGGN